MCRIISSPSESIACRVLRRSSSPSRAGKGIGTARVNTPTTHSMGRWIPHEERSSKPSFQEWLDQHHSGVSILVREHPTMDDLDDPTIPHEAVHAIARDVEQSVTEHRTVVVAVNPG